MTGGIVVISSPADARGFRLVGVTAIAERRDEIERVVSEWVTGKARPPALVLVSPEANALAPGSLAALEAMPSGPVVLVQPREEVAPR